MRVKLRIDSILPKFAKFNVDNLFPATQVLVKLMLEPSLANARSEKEDACVMKFKTLMHEDARMVPTTLKLLPSRAKPRRDAAVCPLREPRAEPHTYASTKST